MNTPSCSICKFWDKREKGFQGWNLGLGKCTNVPVFYDATTDTESPDDFFNDARELKMEYQEAQAFALDGSGYLAELLTRPTFGCVSYQPETPSS